MFIVVEAVEDSEGKRYVLKSLDANINVEFTPNEAYRLAELNKIIGYSAYINENGEEDIKKDSK